MIISSGTAATVTTADTAVSLIAANTRLVKNIRIINGATPGFFSIDGGTTWARLPASTASVETIVVDICLQNAIPLVHGVLVKRIAEGTDLADVYGYAW